MHVAMDVLLGALRNKKQYYDYNDSYLRYA